MTDVFSTLTGDSCVWWVLCSGNQIRVACLKMQKRQEKITEAILCKWLLGKKNKDDVNKKINAFLFLGLFSWELSFRRMQKEKKKWGSGVLVQEASAPSATTEK